MSSELSVQGSAPTIDYSNCKKLGNLVKKQGRFEGFVIYN